MRRHSQHSAGGWRRGLFTWLWVGDNPNVATSEGEIGDLLHLPSAEGRQPHSIKLEVFALKLNRRARRVCLALGHRPKRAARARKRKRAHRCERSLHRNKRWRRREDFFFFLNTAAARFGMRGARGGCCTASRWVDLQPITRERSDVMRAHETQHQDHGRGRARARRMDASHHFTQTYTLQ